MFLHDACHVRYFVVPKQLNLRRVFDMFMSPCKRKQNYWPTAPNIIVGRHVQRTFEHPVACYCMLRQQCWELLRACRQWRANGCNNSQQCWDLQCIVGRIQPISLYKSCVMSVRGPNNVGRAVQTDPTLLRYASAITEQKKCWELLAEKFDRFQTLRNNIQQHATGCAKGRNP